MIPALVFFGHVQPLAKNVRFLETKEGGMEVQVLWAKFNILLRIHYAPDVFAEAASCDLLFWHLLCGKLLTAVEQGHAGGHDEQNEIVKALTVCSMELLGLAEP